MNTYSFKAVDGSILEGGGQILRNTVVLSCLTGQPVVVNNIRAGRSRPGLRPQHLTGLQLVKDLCQGALEGASEDSTEIAFHPGELSAGDYVADTKTAGVCLLLQSALPCLMFTGQRCDVLLRGGTNADMAPQVDYMTMVFKPIAEKFGVRFDFDIRKRGYYPRGGGEVAITGLPCRHLRGVDLTRRGNVTDIIGRAFVAGALPLKMASLMAQNAESCLRERCPGIPIHVEAVLEEAGASVGNGSGIIVVAKTDTGCFLAGTGLGRRGICAENVGRDSARMLIENLDHGGCVDQYMQDQIILLMALAMGTSSVLCGPLTLHTKTAIHVAQELTQAKFHLQSFPDACTLIKCEGIGLQNCHLKQ